MEVVVETCGVSGTQGTAHVEGGGRQQELPGRASLTRKKRTSVPCLSHCYSEFPVTLIQFPPGPEGLH